MGLDFRGSEGVNPSNELGKPGLYVRMRWVGRTEQGPVCKRFSVGSRVTFC